MKSVSLKSLIKRLSTLGLLPKSYFNVSNNSLPEELLALCQTLLQLKGEAASVAISEKVLSTYLQCSAGEKLAFFQLIHEHLTPDQTGVDNAINAYQNSRSQQDLQKLSKCAESPREELFRILNMAPHATQALINMRADLLKMLNVHPGLDVINRDFLHLFRSWFNRGFLELRRIDWSTPALVLEKLIQYESVHEITSWSDLHRRLQDDRRCFGFFHPVMPDTPLIFVEVALTHEMSSSISILLNKDISDSEDNFSHAIFYSINNCLSGLKGVAFGNLLIKQVVESLSADMPSLKNYATLSPIPGFMKWLESNYQNEGLLDNSEQDVIRDFLKQTDKLLYLQNTDELQPMLLKLCSYYLLKEKSRNKPADPVARFHLGNGASLERINWLADSSPNGMKQSSGLMVNYLYEATHLAENHEAYELSDTVVCSTEIQKLCNGKNGK